MKANLVKLYKMLLSDKWYVYITRTENSDIAVMLNNNKVLDKYSADCDAHVFIFRHREGGKIDIVSGPQYNNIIGIF